MKIFPEKKLSTLFLWLTARKNVDRRENISFNKHIAYYFNLFEHTTSYGRQHASYSKIKQRSGL
jgi:hypothetical protein